MGGLKAAGRVGIPRKGEVVCSGCKGTGLLSKRVSYYPGWAMCEKCEGTGVRATPQPTGGR